MILAAAAGWALQTYAGLPGALVGGLLLGMIAAPFVPGSGSCGLPRTGRPGTAD